MMNRTKKVFLNFITSVFYQLLLMVSMFIIPYLMLKSYGSEINGLVSSINQFISFFRLVEAGLAGAAIYALYKPLAGRNYIAINGILVATKKFYINSGYIFLTLTVALAFLYPVLVETISVTKLSIGLLVLILGISGALEFFTLAKYRVLLSADQRSYVISIASIVYVIVNTLIIVVLSIKKIDIILLYTITIFSVFVRTLILMLYVKKRYKFVNFHEVPNFKALDKRWDVLYSQILGAIQMGAPLLILLVVSQDLKLVSVFTIFNLIMVGLNSILSVFVSGLSASFGDIIAKKEQKALQNAYNEFEFLYYTMIAIVYSVSFIGIMPFIRIYTSGVSDIDYNIPIIGFLFVLNGLLYNLKTPQGMLVIAAGLYKETRLQTTIQGLIVIIIGIILTPFLGIIGVIMGSIFSNLYRNIDLILFAPKYVTKLPLKQTLYRIVRLLISIIIIILPFLFLGINPQNIVSWMVYSVTIGCYGILVVIVVGLIFERSSMVKIINRLKGLVRK